MSRPLLNLLNIPLCEEQSGILFIILLIDKDKTKKTMPQGTVKYCYLWNHFLIGLRNPKAVPASAIAAIAPYNQPFGASP